MSPITTSTGLPSGFGLTSPTPAGINFAGTAAPIFKPPAGMTYGSGIGASSGIGSGIAPTLGRFAGGLLGGLTGGGGSQQSQQSQQPQPSRMAGSDEFLEALQRFSSNNSGGGFTSMGPEFGMYQPPTPGATITEKVKSSGGGTSGSKSFGQRLFTAGANALVGGLTAGPAGAIAGGVSGLVA